MSDNIISIQYDSDIAKGNDAVRISFYANIGFFKADTYVSAFFVNVFRQLSAKRETKNHLLCGWCSYLLQWEKVARNARRMRCCLSFTQNSVDGIHKNNVLFP